jgi:hypothetical protein
VSKFNSSWIDRNVYLRPKPGTAPAEHHYEQYERPVIVCLCGSTRFADAFIKAQKDETLAGRIVLTVGLFGHVEGLDMEGPTKQMLDELHKRKIDLADRVLVLNVDGYVGASTRSEVLYARAHHKPVEWLEPDKVPEDLK